MASYNGTTETTTYLGGLVEKVQRGAVTECRHYIPAGAGSMAIHTRRSGASPASSTYYVTGDHLGSATTVMDEAGNYRVTFRFEGGHAYEVDYEDYH